MREGEIQGAPRSLTPAEAGTIYDVLTELAGAVDDKWEKHSFVAYVSKANSSQIFVEWRFCGSLGFGGKLYFDGYRIPRIGCYREHETPARLATIAQVNACFAEMFAALAPTTPEGRTDRA